MSFAGRSEVYAAGMRLPPGDYRIRVSAEGYETLEERVRHGTDPTRLEVSLDRSVPQPGETFADALASGGNGPEIGRDFRRAISAWGACRMTTIVSDEREASP